MAESLQEIERMPVRKTSSLQHRMQGFALRVRAGVAAQARLHAVELREFLCGVGRFMVSDIIGRARESVEGQDRRAQLGPNQARSHGKVLVAVPLPRSEIGGHCHVPPVMAWTRPFHIPPRPRHTSSADCTVKRV